MMDLNKKNLPLPPQTEGTQKDIQDSISFPQLQKALAFYPKAKERLLGINRWGALCGGASATFTLTDKRGNPVDGHPEVGFHFKIDVPGPGAAAGKGFDWVQVEAMSEKGDSTSDLEYTIITVRPASDPTTANENTAHFFTSKATSNFLLLREGPVVTAAVLGRNEVANTEEDDNLLDKIRNLLVGASAKFGMADPQWQSLVKGILGKTDSFV